MKLFTKEIDQKLFDQYMMGNNLEDQMVVAKIFNPYGNGVWYLLNSDPSDPDYIWAIVDLFDVEMGSVSREELETLKVPPFRLGLERDLYFTPVNAKKLYESLLKGEKFEDGGTIDIKKDQNGDNWVFPNNPQGDTYGIKLAAGGMTAGRWYKDNSGQELRYIGESQGKLLFNDGEKIVYKDESDFEEAPKQKKMFGFFEDGGEVYSKPLNRATNLKVRDYLEKEGLSKQETGGDYEKFLGQALVTSLRDSNFSKEANEIIYILDKSVKGDEVYDTKYYNPIPSIVRIGEKVAKICKYDAVEITDAYFFVSKMYGTGSVANAIAKVFGRYELSGKFKFEEGGYMSMGGESKGKRYKVNVYYGGEMEDEEFYTDSLDEAERASQGGEHSEIYDNEKKEFVEVEYAKGGMFEFKPYGKTKGIYKIYYKADGKPQTEIWETKEMAVSAAKRYSSPKMADEYSNVKVFDEDGSEVDYMSETTYAKGGETEAKQLLVLKADDEKGGNVFVREEVVEVEDLNDAKSKVKGFVSKYKLNDKTFTGGRYFKLIKTSRKSGNVSLTDVKSETLGYIDYKGDFTPTSSKMAMGGELMKHKHNENITIELIEPTNKGWKVKQIETHSIRGRKLSAPKEKVTYFSKEEIKELFEPIMAKGGTTKFKDKVQSIKASLLKRKKVSPKVQKDYGKTYSPKEAEESAKRIAGSMVKKEKRKPRVSKMLEKMKKGTQINKKKSTFKDRMKELSTKIKERKSKTTK